MGASAAGQEFLARPPSTDGVSEQKSRTGGWRPVEDSRRSHLRLSSTGLHPPVLLFCSETPSVDGGRARNSWPAALAPIRFLIHDDRPTLVRQSLDSRCLAALEALVVSLKQIWEVQQRDFKWCQMTQWKLSSPQAYLSRVLHVFDVDDVVQTGCQMDEG